MGGVLGRDKDIDADIHTYIHIDIHTTEEQSQSLITSSVLIGLCIKGFAEGSLDSILVMTINVTLETG